MSSNIQKPAHIRSLPEDAQTLLLFLASHEEGTMGVEADLATGISKDPSATLIIEGQKILLTYGDGKEIKRFTSEDEYIFYTLQIPSGKRHGTLYFRGLGPSGGNTFWIQQYPTYFGEAGRIVIEFWNNKEIVAVFKTPGGNFGALGEGKWQD